MELKFEKWQGAQNDFMVVRLPAVDQEILLSSLRRQAERLCHRHKGVGADGILVLWEKAKNLRPESLSIINSDGSLAQNCGNGLRCATGSVFRFESPQSGGYPFRPGGSIMSGTRSPGQSSAEREAAETLELKVEGRSMLCRLLGKSGDVTFIGVAMPVPHLNQDLSWWDTGKSELHKIIELAKVQQGSKEFSYEGAAVEVGNQHVVVGSDDMNQDWVRSIGPQLQKVPLWDGINVHGIRPKPVTDKDRARIGQEIGGRLGSLFDVWVWERGAGETLACGSGGGGRGGPTPRNWFGRSR